MAVNRARRVVIIRIRRLTEIRTRPFVWNKNFNLKLNLNFNLKLISGSFWKKKKEKKSCFGNRTSDLLINSQAVRVPPRCMKNFPILFRVLKTFVRLLFLFWTQILNLVHTEKKLAITRVSVDWFCPCQRKYHKRLLKYYASWTGQVLRKLVRSPLYRRNTGTVPDCRTGTYHLHLFCFRQAMSDHGPSRRLHNFREGVN